MKNRFPENLKLLRIASGMTLGELAEKTLISDKNLSFYETGRREPYLSGLLAIASVFNVKIEYLVHSELEFKITEKPQINTR